MEEGNHGIYIDTVAVPQDENISIENNQGKEVIKTVRNVTFKLYCSVDAKWSIVAADATNTSVEEGKVTVDQYSGQVEIRKDAAGGNYTITATAQNVKNVDVASIKLVVNATSSPAKAKKITWDEEAMTDEQISVSEDGMKLLVDGYVEETELAVKFEPDYLLDKEISFTSSSESYSLSGYNNKLFTTADSTSARETEIIAYVGKKTDTNNVQETRHLNVDIKEKKLAVSVDSPEFPNKNSNNTYTLQKDQYINFFLNSNEDQTLDAKKRIMITSVEWTFSQDDIKLEAAE